MITKHTIFITCFVFLATLCQAQNFDSLIAEPQLIELKISTPQPRLKETFQISLDVGHLRANIFKSLFGKVEIADDISIDDDTELTLNVKAIDLGKIDIGPIEFYLDKTKYSTPRITYEVIEALPDVDEGLWFRKVMTSDTSFCIIIEQRIPAVGKTTNKPDNSIEFTTEPEYDEIVRFKNSYSMDGMSGRNSHSNTDFGKVRIEGVQRRFMYGYSVYYFFIEDKNASIKITKDKFLNLPEGYKFEDIVIQ